MPAMPLEYPRIGHASRHADQAHHGVQEIRPVGRYAEYPLPGIKQASCCSAARLVTLRGRYGLAGSVGFLVWHGRNHRKLQKRISVSVGTGIAAPSRLLILLREMLFKEFADLVGHVLASDRALALDPLVQGNRDVDGQPL